MMQFMRDHRKGLLIIFVVIFAVCFGLPSFMGRNRGNRNVEVGSYLGVDGSTTKLNSMEVGEAGARLKAMLELQIPQVMVQYGSYSDTLAMINPIASSLTCNAVFTDPRTAYMTRSFLMESARYAATDTKDLEKIYNDITKLVDSNKQSVTNYIVLSAEAHRNGYYATDDQINFVISVAKHNINQRGMKMSSMLHSFGMTLSSLEQGVGDLIAIASYADEITKVGSINENEIRSLVRESVEVNNMSGKYVEFSASMFSEKAGEPSEEEILAQFNKYKSIDPESIKTDDETNPFGYSYMLPDRVKVEYLDVSVSDINKTLQAEFDAKDVTEQEELLQEYWAVNKTQEQYQTRIPAEDPQGQPKLVQKSFDEVYTMVKRNYINEQAKAKADSVMANVRDAVRNDNELVQANIDWQKVAEKNSSNVSVKYGSSDFLSYESVGNFERFGSARVTRLNNAPLSQVLFSCEPLRDMAVSKMDNPPLKLNQPQAFIEAGYGTNISNLYIVRIVAVDKSREPVSLDDDGRQGAAAVAPLTEGENLLRDKVVKDLKDAKAFAMAVDKAVEFQGMAKADWATAIETVGNSMKDSEDETARNPLMEKDLATIYSQIETTRQRMQDQPEYAQRLQGTLNYYFGMLSPILKAYRDVETGELMMVKAEGSLSVKVFDELVVEPANQADLAQSKGRFTIQAMQKNQLVPLVEMFMQDNVDSRNAVENFNQKEAESEEAKTDEAPAEQK